jgi:hypothetical protein
MDITLNRTEQEEHGHSLEKRTADDLDEEERQLEALIEEVYSTKWGESLSGGVFLCLCVCVFTRHF